MEECRRDVDKIVDYAICSPMIISWLSRVQKSLHSRDCAGLSKINCHAVRLESDFVFGAIIYFFFLSIFLSRSLASLHHF